MTLPFAVLSDMRTDAVDTALALIVVLAFVAVWLVKDEDPDWNRRWNELSPSDRARIAKAARSGALLAPQEEIDRAAGFARRERSRRGPLSLIATIRVPIGAALIA